jgi:uncharacterized protein YecE (DUF72 family)
MVTIHIGCAGWLYEDWRGSFYPKGLETRDFLPYYAKAFNMVEINSTFYNLPTKETVNNWYDRVPANFRFIVKVWQEITHKLDNPDVDFSLIQFFDRMNTLKDKIYAYLFQFPPWFHYSPKHLDIVKSLIKQSPSEYKYVIELRHNSWFEEDILDQIGDNERILIGTSYLEGFKPCFKINQKYYYIRLIGDRELSVFNRVQREQKEEISDLLQIIRKFHNDPNIYEIFIIVNNHYTGFAPETVNLLKKELDLPFKSFSQQKKLSDYF